VAEQEVKNTGVQIPVVDVVLEIGLSVAFEQKTGLRIRYERLLEQRMGENIEYH